MVKNLPAKDYDTKHTLTFKLLSITMIVGRNVDAETVGQANALTVISAMVRRVFAAIQTDVAMVVLPI